MKRLGFKPEFQDDIRSGVKTGTLRARKQPLRVGDFVAAVSGKDGKPDFLVPASEAFATLYITEEEFLPWGRVTDEHLRRTTVDRGWYERHIKGLDFDTDLWFYGFEVVEAERG